MASQNISKRSVDAAHPKDRQFVLWDVDIKGFGLLVLPSGTKSYIYQYRLGGRGSRLRRFTIGRHGSLTPEQARKLARELSEDVRRGVDPIEAKRDAERAEAQRRADDQQMRELTFARYAERWLEQGLKPGTREGTKSGYESALRLHMTPKLGDKALAEIVRGDIVKVLDAIPTKQPAVRRIVFAVARLLFGWAQSRGDIEISPIEGIQPPPPATSRDRVLSDDELALAIRATMKLDAPFGPLYRLLIATGQRRNEAAGLSWSELDRNERTWTLPGDRSKNREPHVIPLNRQAMTVLDMIAGVADADEARWPRKGLVFSTTGKTHVSGFSRSKRRLDGLMLEIARKDAENLGDDPDDCAIRPWRLHDVRRTLATAMQRLGVRFEVTEAILNHVSGASRSGIAAVYQRHSWGPEKRAALDAWADYCDQLIAPAEKTDNIVPLRAAKSSGG